MALVTSSMTPLTRCLGIWKLHAIVIPFGLRLGLMGRAFAPAFAGTLVIFKPWVWPQIFKPWGAFVQAWGTPSGHPPCTCILQEVEWGTVHSRTITHPKWMIPPKRCQEWGAQTHTGSDVHAPLHHSPKRFGRMEGSCSELSRPLLGCWMPLCAPKWCHTVSAMDPCQLWKAWLLLWSASSCSKFVASGWVIYQVAGVTWGECIFVNYCVTLQRILENARCCTVFGIRVGYRHFGCFGKIVTPGGVLSFWSYYF